MFALAYLTKGGFTYPIEEMDASDREWFIERLDKQLKAEERAMRSKGRKR